MAGARGDSSNPRSGEGVSVSVLYSQTNEVKEFTNQTEAGEFLGVTRQEIYNAIKRGTSINGIYLISKIKLDILFHSFCY